MSVTRANRISSASTAMLGAPDDIHSLREQLNALHLALQSNDQAVTTLREQAQEQLHATEKRYRELFDNVLTGVMRSTPEGTILLANPALVEMLGYSTFKDLASQNLSQHYPHDQPRAHFVSLMRTEGQVIGYESSLVRRDGSVFQARITAKAVLGPDRAVQYFEGVVEDITKRKHAELLDRDRNRILAMVAHGESLQNVLNEISLMVERQIAGSTCAITRRSHSHLYLVAGPSLSIERAAELAGGVLVGPESMSCGAAAHYCKTIIVGNTAQDPIWSGHRAFAERHNLKSVSSVPIISGASNVLGTVGLSHQCVHAPLAGELDVLKAAAGLAAVAMEQRLLHEELEYQANNDRLTQLPNRLGFDDRLERTLGRSGQQRAAIVWIDLDRFKEINDTLGYHTGDALLRQVAQRFQQCLLPPAVLARMGGDEFAVLLPEICESEDPANCARKLLESLREPFHVEGHELFVTASIGTCLHPEDGLDTATLQRNADMAMYRAKDQGRNRYFCFEPAIGTSAVTRLELQNNLRHSVERQELELFYQPEIDLNGDLKAVEALIRWNHPRFGLLMPADFISKAEESGLIIPIGTWVVQEACRQMAFWRKSGYPHLRIAVNVSPLQIYYGDFVEVVRKALAKAGLDPAALEIELTEGVVMGNIEESGKQMAKLRALGVSIAIDDFGTGYSSLAYLQRLPVDALKLDRSFLRQIESKPASSVVAAVTMLGRSLGLRVVAEGIEEQTQFNIVRDIGVDLIQGFLIGRPLPAMAASKSFGTYGEALRFLPEPPRVSVPGHLII